MSPLTPRELRVIADHVERLTKARVVNAQLGVETSPNLMTVAFPNGFTGSLIWMLGVHTDDPKMRQRVARQARQRDCYQLDAATLTPTSSTTRDQTKAFTAWAIALAEARNGCADLPDSSAPPAR